MFDQYYDKNTKIITVPEAEFKPYPGGLGWKIFDCMNKYLENIAQIDTITNKEDTYKSFLQRCIRTAIEIKRSGIQLDDVIVLCSQNHLNSAVPFIAALFLGIQVFSLDPLLSDEDIIHFINLIQPKIIFASLECEDQIENAINKTKCITRIIIYGNSIRNERFSTFLKQKKNENEFKPRYISNLSETALIVSSSGTTGLPKGICLSHEYILHSCRSRHLYPNVLTFATLYWGSTVITSILAIFTGKTKIVAPKYNPETVWELLEKFTVAALFLLPCDALSLYRNRKCETVENFPLKLLVIGGSFLGYDYLKKIEQMLPNTKIEYFYGQIEVFDVLDCSSMMRKNDSVGFPTAGKSYKIVDIETEQPLGFNQRGELRIKSKWCMSGYYKQDCAVVFDEEGYLKTGDVVYYDEDFCFYIVDRVKEMFKYKGWHVVPTKIEKVLLNHPDIKYAVVVGMPHEEDENHAMGIVQLIKNSNMQANDIEKFVNENMLDFRHKLKAGVRIISDMPITPSGKIKRKVVKDMFMV